MNNGFGRRVILDNSAWARLLTGRIPDVTQALWEGSVNNDEVLVCDPFRLEALYSARDGRDYERLDEELDAFAQAPCDDRVWRLAHNAQHALAAAEGVSHRVKPVDLLVAAAAQRHDAGVLHYDHHFDLLAQHTDLSFESIWLAPRGTLS